MSARRRQVRELNGLWAQWLDIVVAATQSARQIKRKSDLGYGELHQSIMSRTDALLSTESNVTTREVYEKMKAECRPWVSLEALAHAERQVLLSLLDRSIALHQQLAPGGYWRRRIARLIPKAVACGVVAGAAYLLYGTDLAREISQQAYRMWYMTRSTNLLTWLVVVLVFVVISGVWMLRQTREF